MPKKEMTPEEASLFLQLKKLSKRANQRLLRLERLTGETETFASKQLYDYLSSETLNAISKTGRVRVSKNFSQFQMEAIIKATEEFLSDPLSKTGSAKKYAKSVSAKTGQTLTWGEVNAYFQVTNDTTWIYEYVDPSTFWAISREAVKRGWSEETWIEELQRYSKGNIPIDGIYKNRLDKLFKYIQGMNV